MPLGIDPGDVLGFLGVAFGALMTYLASRQARRPVRTDVQTSIIQDLQEERDKAWSQVAALETKAETMTVAMDAAMDAARTAQEEAYRMTDAARLQVNMAASYIYQLRAHIDGGQPPPSPDIPQELYGLLQIKNH